MVRRPLAVATAATMLLATAACGGGGDDAASQPVGAQSSSPTVSPTESPTPSETATESPTPTARPLSRFEDEPPVIAARQWAAAMARSVNRRDETLQAAARYMTASGRERYQQYAAPDMGLYYPGPMPFTPTGVKVNGRSAQINICWWALGFAQDRDTKRPAEGRKIEPGTMFLKKQGDRWKMHDQLLADGDCNKVPVKGMGW
jgi:hypothetical protein